MYVALTVYIPTFAMWLLTHPLESRPKGPTSTALGMESRQSDLYQTSHLFLPTLVETLEQHGHLIAGHQNQLLSMSVVRT